MANPFDQFDQAQGGSPQGGNPFAGVRVRMPKYEERTRTKDLTEDEAKIILRAALEPPNKRMAPEYQAPSNGFLGFLPTPARG